MSLRRKLLWTLPPLALLALIGWSLPSASATPPPAQTRLETSQQENQPQASGIVPAPGPAALPPSVAGPDRSAAVAKFVNQKNEEQAHERDAFTQAGWQFVKTTPPDQKLLALDPALLPSREEDLRFQISSTTPRAEDAANLSRIAREAHDSLTQAAAIDALGRIHDGGAQDQLLGLLSDLPGDSEARKQIAPLLHPTDLSDPRATKLAQLLDSPALNPVERKQIAFTLALIGLRDGTALSPEIAARLSQDSLSLIGSMTQLASLRTP